MLYESGLGIIHRTPFQSLQDLAMDSSNINGNGKVLKFKLDLLNTIENHIFNLKIRNNGNINSILKNFRKFLTNLKSESFNLISVNPSSKSQSLISMVDIEMQIVDENTPIKDVKITPRSIIFFKETSTNTESDYLIDQCVQTHPIKVSVKDQSNDMAELRTQCNDVQELINTFNRKRMTLIEAENNTREVSLKAVDYMQQYFNYQKKKFVEIEIQTEESWMRDSPEVHSSCDMVSKLEEELSAMEGINDVLEERIQRQSTEVEAQFEMVEELTNRDQQLTKRKDSLTRESLGLREMNEFLELESEGVVSATRKLNEDMDGFRKLHERKADELRSLTRTERCRSSVEKIQYEQMGVDQLNDRRKMRMDRQLGNDRLDAMGVSVKEYLRFVGGCDVLVEGLRARKAEVEACLSVREEEAALWTAKRDTVRESRAEESRIAQEGLATLKSDCEGLEARLKAIRATNDIYRQSFMDLRTVALDSKERSSHDEADICEQILRKYESLLQ